MANVQPPPTYAEVILIEPQTGKAKFNPVWLKWFLDLVGIINTAGGLVLDHNSLDSIQGGSTTERFHLTSPQQAGVATDVIALVALAAGMLAKTGAGAYAARTIIGTVDQITVGNGSGAAGNPTISLPIGKLLTGKYTPTLSNVLNLDGSTAYEAQYARIGDRVVVSGRIDADPTAAGAVQLGISLPVASNLGAAEDCAGVAFCPTVAAEGAAVLADTVNDRAQMEWIAVNVTNQPRYFHFMYDVI